MSVLTKGVGLVMRISAQAKSATRQRIVNAAAELFQADGFEATTTRDIAVRAQIATGTLFNYFATKESIMAAIAATVLEESHETLLAESGAAGSLSEALFALIARELRQLKPYRNCVMPLLETALSPLAAADSAAASEPIRIRHLEVASELCLRHGIPELSAVALQLYWTLYTGVLAFWVGDNSPKQEDTLALLDQSIAMFVAWLSGRPDSVP